MDFSTNRVQSPSANRSAAGAPDPAGGGKKAKSKEWQKSPGWLKVVWIVLLFAVTILIVSITALMLLGNSKKEAGYVNNEKVQAVFLDNGQVYFGNIHAITNDYIDLQGIYYLSVDQPVQPEQENMQQEGNITLQKLGCELHGPVDQMIVNRAHVTFWENLRHDGQVSQAIDQWIEQHPEGLECPSPDEQQQVGEQPEATVDEEEQE